MSTMPLIRLWTFQDQIVVDQLMAGQAHHGDWERTPENWRLAYRWMAMSLTRITPELGEHALVWCWHSCNGVLGQPPTVETATSLLTESDFERDLVVLELAVPSDKILLSSYYAWNRFMDFLIEKHRVPRSPRRIRRMFEEPLLRHSTDNIQAVTPLIKPSWLIRSSRLTVDGRDSDELLVPIN